MTNQTAPELDRRAINTIRVMAADVVQKAKSGHPGAPMGCAPLAHVLFSRHLVCSPTNPKWINRDRFVLSNGHACALQYTLLHLLGYDVTLDDLKSFRQLGSRTPGHPEAHVTDGIEVTTGPLGQGIANAVGLAIAERHMAARYNQPGFERLIDSRVFCLVGDGCLQEGVASEACSLAGHLQLGNLIVLYDDNQVQIDGGTDLAFTENVEQRFASYGWHTLHVADGDSDLEALSAAIAAAAAVRDRPSLIRVKTTIGFGSSKQGTEKVHGAALGDDDVAQIKRAFGFDPAAFFHVPPEVYAHYRSVAQAGTRAETAWNALFDKYRAEHKELAAELEGRFSDAPLPLEAIKAAVPRYSPADAAAATRKLSEHVLNSICAQTPSLIGGSADLTTSNLTKWKGSVDFQGPAYPKLGSYAGRYLRYGVREHAMYAIMNGLAAFGGIVPFGGTFLNFVGYGVGAVRLAALSHLQVLYVLTHDSIGLGEDGPTHQPVEALASLRAMPNVVVLRPADGNEVSGAYLVALSRRGGPSALALTRQNLPQLHGSSVEGVSRGAYVLAEHATAAVTLLATGSEVHMAVQARDILAKEGIAARVVSAPSLELFDEQDVAYRAQVLPPGIPTLSFEVLATFGFSKYAHASFGLDQFGSSGPYEQVYAHFGFTASGLASRARSVVEFYRTRPVPNLVERPF